ncbi:Nuclear transcription factor Y subunit C-1 [Acorus calamus]|uniref:Nuclear transcription factor Y subunit C-1 n=1 Tax=Acorus calamus TaxID=4465 RepID=A0AAV9DLI2_ACOCL|nr:Nuclear transcription factor Y subunit C-1 [Acorus calamus]
MDPDFQMFDPMHVPRDTMAPLPPALANLPNHHLCHHLKAGMDTQYCLNLIDSQNKNLGNFWRQQVLEMENMQEVRPHLLPLARIKRIMKADGQVKMISGETPILFSKACELFIQDLTLRSWLHANQGKRRTIQKIDVASAVCHDKVFDFLDRLVPMTERKDMEPENQGDWIFKDALLIFKTRECDGVSTGTSSSFHVPSISYHVKDVEGSLCFIQDVLVKRLEHKLFGEWAEGDDRRLESTKE